MKKILLVEDDRGLQEIYGVRLEAEGYKIVFANNGEEAITIAMKEKPDLILSDIMMPKISGFDMLDILKSNNSLINTKVIVMTALSSDDQRAKGEALGIDKYLVKSQVGIEDVINAVNQVFQADEQTDIKQVKQSISDEITNEAPINKHKDEKTKSENQVHPTHESQPQPATPEPIPQPIISTPDSQPTPPKANINQPIKHDSIGLEHNSVPDRTNYTLKDIIPPRR